MLDTITVLVVTGLVYLVMPINTWVAVRNIPQPSTVLWCVGSFITGIAIMLIGLRQEIPVFWSIFVAQLLLIYSFFLRARGLQQDLAQSPSPHIVLLGLTLTYGTVMGLLLVAEWIFWLDLWVRTCNALLVLWFTGQIFKYARELKSRNAMAMAFIYSLLTMAFVYNMILTWTGQSSLFDNHVNPAMVLIGLTGIISAIFGHINYLGVVYEGSIRSMALEQTKTERATQSQKMLRTLTVLDRQIRMGALSTSLSHAISQPLASMLIHLRQAQKWITAPLEDRVKAQIALTKVVEETQRAADTIEEIRRFLRPSKPNVELFDPAVMLNNVKSLLYHELINNGAQLEVSRLTSNYKIYGDKLQLTHAFLTLVQSLLSSNKQGRRNKIEFQCQQIDQKFIIKIIHNGLSLTEKDVKMPAMIISQFDGSIKAEGSSSTWIELTAPTLPTVSH